MIYLSDMSIFKGSDEFKEIESNLYDVDIKNEIARFVCYFDHQFTYHYDDEVYKYEFNIIADQSTFLDEETINDLIAWKNPTFFEYNVYINSTDEQIKQVLYREMDYINLN